MDAATQELNEAKAEYVKVVDRITSASENPSSAALSAIRDRLNELGDWENELKDAMNESDDEGPKRLVLKMKR